MYGMGLIKRSKESEAWMCEVPRNPPPRDLVSMLHYDVKVMLHLGDMDPAALEKSWRFYMFSEPATANSAMQLASDENAFLKRKGNIPSLFVTDVKALVLLGFISSGGAKMESLGMAACFHGLVRGSGLLMYFLGLLCGIPRFPISVFMASSFPTFLEEADASQAPLVAAWLI